MHCSSYFCFISGVEAMRACVLIVLVASAIVIAWLLDTTVPEGHSNPWTCRMVYGVIKLIFLLVSDLNSNLVCGENKDNNSSRCDIYIKMIHI